MCSDSDALAVDEPMGEVGLSTLCAPCLRAANEHGAHDNGVGWPASTSM